MRTFELDCFAQGKFELSRVGFECGERGPGEQPVKTYASVHLGGRKPGAALFTVVQSPEMEPGPTGRRAELLGA